MCPRAFSTYLLVEFSFVNFECPVLFVLFYPVLVSSESSFELSLLVVFSDLSAVLFWSVHSNISLSVFPSLALSLVVTVSLPILLA